MRGTSSRLTGLGRGPPHKVLEEPQSVASIALVAGRHKLSSGARPLELGAELARTRAVGARDRVGAEADGLMGWPVVCYVMLC